jgi:hypothetical protein
MFVRDRQVVNLPQGIGEDPQRRSFPTWPWEVEVALISALQIQVTVESQHRDGFQIS